MKYLPVLMGLVLAAATQEKMQEPAKVEIVSPLPYGSEGKEYSITKPGFNYPASYASFDTIDTKNFVFHNFLGKRHAICGQLKNGYWESREDGAMYSLRLLGEHRLPSHSETEAFLLVIAEEFDVAGSSDSQRLAQIWRLSDGKLSIVEQISYNTHFQGGGDSEKFDKNDQRLIVHASHYLSSDAHCCVSAYDELTFRWSGSEFVLTRIETKRIQHDSDTGSIPKKN